MTIIAVTLSVFGLVILILGFGKIQQSFQFSKDVKSLFAQSKNASGQVYHENQLVHLPEPVQRYFRHILKNGQPYIGYARIKHDGQFKPGFDKAWLNIQGEQYATTEKPGFIWKGTTTLFVAFDMYIADKGRLIVTLLSLYPIVNAQGKPFDQGELLRWLGEGVMYPTIFLPGKGLEWMPIDANTAKLTFDYKDLSLFFIVKFDEKGEITEMETKRYMEEKRLETWVIKVTNYKKWHEVLIPTAFEVLWRLEKGDFAYAKFNITEVEYNIAEKF
ncbi:MAG: DUF6544 family protein [Saprospiraceae bacterium]